MSTQSPEKNSDIQTPRMALFAEISAVFSLYGSLSGRVQEHMQPLLNGTMNYEQHEAMLQAMLERAAHE